MHGTQEDPSEKKKKNPSRARSELLAFVYLFPFFGDWRKSYFMTNIKKGDIPSIHNIIHRTQGENDRKYRKWYIIKEI